MSNSVASATNEPDDPQRLAELLEDYHRRRALGETPTPENYREAAGDLYDEFLEVLEAEKLLDEAMAEEDRSKFPMPFGEYTLLSELGRGAVGVVYEAMHRGLGRTVALKILKSGFDTHPNAIARFQRESRASAQVRHDHIVEIYEAGQYEGRYFYAMARLEGKDLTAAARAGELGDLRSFAASAAGVADALQTLHERAIIHRDVKPHNIIVERSGRLVLADFGLARTVSSEKLTQTGEMLGTPLYMSPEQLLGSKREVDGRTDVYCLGATLFEALSGQPIFPAEDMAALMRMVLRERPRHLAEVAPQVPEELANIVMKAVEKRTEDRYETAAAMRDDLLAFARGERVVGRPLSNSRRLAREVRRRARWLLPAAAVLLGAVIFAATRPPEPARLSLASHPPSRVSIDGELKGDTPLGIEIAPGQRELKFEAQGWRLDRTARFEAGRTYVFDVVLRPDEVNPETMGAVAKAVDTDLETWNGMARDRGIWDSDRIEVLFPRGRARLEDLDSYRFVIGPRFDAEGALVFRSGGRELFRRAINSDWPDRLSITEPMPAAVRDALEAGATVTWGYEPAEGDAVLARFEVVAAEEGIAVAAARIEDQEPVVADLILAQLLLDAGLDQAAYVKARTHPTVPAAWAIMKAALDRLDLRGSDPWRDLATISVR